MEPPAADRAQLTRLIYDEGKASLASQRATVDGLRSRTGLLFTVAALAVSLLGTRVVEPSPSTWLALVCFVGVALLAVVIWWPQPRFATDTDPGRLVEALFRDEVAPTSEQFQCDLVLAMVRARDVNERHVTRLNACFRVASLLTVVDVLSCVVHLLARS